MKKSNKLNRENLKSINGGATCNFACPPGPYGPGFPRSCADYDALPACCKPKVLLSFECAPD
ncbi:hypothetical protein [Chryseobacterium paridis]|uniref:Bacteriocin n=1 Tax=Chryseobacterium paridis TaxID=2800328 RepID=A0ABS1FZU2_9FLAO|nr:hypothetical protein [Chryseobacterium paridis]MBK1897912.1 hypothetical protein [Chryseobacterium paridis]